MAGTAAVVSAAAPVPPVCSEVPPITSSPDRTAASTCNEGKTNRTKQAIRGWMRLRLTGNGRGAQLLYEAAQRDRWCWIVALSRLVAADQSVHLTDVPFDNTY